MTKYKIVTGKRLIKAILKNNYIKKSQSGSHVFLINTIDKFKIAVVPDTTEDLTRGLMEGIRKQMKLTKKEFIEILGSC